MFDLSFGKLLLLLIVGLIVLGPTRLPIVMKKIAMWIGAMRRLTASVQMEINKELKLQEIQDILKKASQFDSSTISPEMQQTMDDLKQMVESLKQNINETTVQMQNHVLNTAETEQKIETLKEAMQHAEHHEAGEAEGSEKKTDQNQSDGTSKNGK